MPGHRITLTGEKQTLLITLYAKALDSRLDDSILHDRFAEEAVRQIDFDFSRVALGKGNERALAMRSHYFDQACRDFLGRHPEGQVLNLGCGLDSRIYRVDPPAELPWFDLDYPEVMDLRERLYPPRAGAYRALRHSVDDDGWLQGVPRERPALVLAEGLMPYLRESQVRRWWNAWSTTWVAASCCSTATAASASCCCACIRRCARPGRRCTGASTTRANSSGGIRPCASSRRSPTTTRRTLPSCRSRRG